MKERFNSAVGLNDGLNGPPDGLKKENDGLKFIELEEFLSLIDHNKDLENLCRMIAKEPAITMKSMSNLLQVSLKTIERRIKILKEKGILQHNGAKKNGEYVFAPSISDSIINWLAVE